MLFASNHSLCLCLLLQPHSRRPRVANDTLGYSTDISSASSEGPQVQLPVAAVALAQAQGGERVAPPEARQLHQHRACALILRRREGQCRDAHPQEPAAGFRESLRLLLSSGILITWMQSQIPGALEN